MIKTNELRVGNFLLFENEVQIVSSIHSDNTIRLRKTKNEECHGCYKVNNTSIKPIPLHIEWLIRLGVNEVKSQEVLRINYVKYYKSDNTFDYCLCYYFDDDGYVDNVFKEIKYVHELQNLYFALTGSELQYVA